MSDKTLLTNYSKSISKTGVGELLVDIPLNIPNNHTIASITIQTPDAALDASVFSYTNNNIKVRCRNFFEGTTSIVVYITVLSIKS